MRQEQPITAGGLSKEAVLDSLKEAYRIDSSGMHFWEVARSHRYAKPPWRWPATLKWPQHATFQHHPPAQE